MIQNLDSRKKMAAFDHDLEELNVKISAVRPEEIKNVMEIDIIGKLFERIHDSNGKHVELACKILSKILSAMSTKEILDFHQKDLYEGLFQKNPYIKSLALKTLVRITENASESNLPSAIGHEMLVEVASLLTEEDEDTLRDCNRILLQISRSDVGLRAVFCTEVVTALQKIMAHSEVVRFRVYDVIINIGTQSKQGFAMSVENHYIEQLTSEIKSDDVLVQLNCLEMLAEVASTPYGLFHLEDTGILRNLENLFSGSGNPLIARFLQPGLIKFFGSIAHLHPKKTCERHPTFLNEVYTMLESNNPASIGVAIETVGIVGSSIEGKFVLQKMVHLMSKYVEILGIILKASNEDSQLKGLVSLECLLNLPEPEQTTELVDLVRSWYDRAAICLTERVITLMKSPFEHVRLAAMSLIRALARLAWSQTYLNDHPGFLEYLLDRSTESGNKDGKEAKFEIIKTLAESPNTPMTMGNVVLLRFREYVIDGPYFVRSEATVDIEGST